MGLTLRELCKGEAVADAWISTQLAHFRSRSPNLRRWLQAMSNSLLHPPSNQSTATFTLELEGPSPLEMPLGSPDYSKTTAISIPSHAPDHTTIYVQFQPWNCWRSYSKINVGPPLFTLLQPEMPTYGVKTSRCDQPLSVGKWPSHITLQCNWRAQATNGIWMNEWTDRHGV